MAGVAAGGGGGATEITRVDKVATLATVGTSRVVGVAGGGGDGAAVSGIETTRVERFSGADGSSLSWGKAVAWAARKSSRLAATTWSRGSSIFADRRLRGLGW